MNFLLKIVEGPMKGAEIALVDGLRVRIGSGEDCDIVLADSSLPAEAFALDVKSDSVSFIQGEEVKTLVPFEVFESGSSEFAIGPAEGVWGPLKRKAAAAAEPEAASADGVDGSVPPKQVGLGNPASAGNASESETESGEAQDDSKKGRGFIAGIFVILILLLAAFLFWLFWPRISSVCGFRAPTTDPATIFMAPSLADLASQYNLVLTNSPTSQPLLIGNFVRRTEKLAVRALALAADPTVKLELTDDESLFAAARELLFVVTENDITVTAATNGVVTIAGYAPSAVSLERTIRAMNDDVPGLKNVLAAAVQVGGVPPVKQDAAVDPVAAPAANVASSRVAKKGPAVRTFPIAGILTTPYKTVVLSNGMRVTEGGIIGGAVVERIEPDRLVFKSGATTFEWKP